MAEEKPNIWQNTRRYERRKVDVPGWVSMADSQVHIKSDKIKAQVIDLSYGGAQLEFGLYIPKGITVSIEMDMSQFPDFASDKKIVTQGMILWCRQFKRQCYRAGIKFIEPASELKEKLQGILSPDINRSN